MNEIREDLRNYYSYMANTEENLDKLIAMEKKYGVYGATPEMFCCELADQIEEEENKKALSEDKA